MLRQAYMTTKKSAVLFFVVIFTSTTGGRVWRLESKKTQSGFLQFVGLAEHCGFLVLRATPSLRGGRPGSALKNRAASRTLDREELGGVAQLAEQGTHKP